MQFQINGQDYYLNFVPDEGRWFLFTQTHGGVAAIPVVDDDAKEDATPSIN